MPLSTELSKIKDGSVVYISAQNLNKYTLDRIPGKVVCVIGDDDHTFPYSYFPHNIERPHETNYLNQDYEVADHRLIATCHDYTTNFHEVYYHSDFLSFIESEKVIHCFIQNCAITHPKITKIPIGMDYHTLRNYNITPEQHEEFVMGIYKRSRPFWERPLKCYGNFHFSYKGSKFGYDRREALEQIPSELVFYEDTYIEKHLYYIRQSEFAFVISPHGNGLDCHRTWESLCIGCIPIVKSSVLDDLFEDLPVLIVKNWSDISQELLQNTVTEFNRKYGNVTLPLESPHEGGDLNRQRCKKLSLKYWQDLFYEKSTNFRSNAV